MKFLLKVVEHQLLQRCSFVTQLRYKADKMGPGQASGPSTAQPGLEPLSTPSPLHVPTRRLRAQV